MIRRPVVTLCTPLLVTCLLSAPLAAQGKGTTKLEIQVGEQVREYLLHVPRKYPPGGREKVPLVLMLHGRGSGKRQAASSYYGWVEMADKEGFIAAFPEALGKPRSWKAAWGRESTDDGAFLAALIDDLVKSYRIDPRRVFMTGHSSGGIMSFSFAATHSDKVAAIGPVAGTIGISRGKLKLTVPKPGGPVRVISFHGMADKIVAYDANTKAAFPGLVSAPDSAAFWGRHNGGSEKPERKDILDGKVHVDTWKGGKTGADVVFYSIEGGSHGWPRGETRATELIWAFFKQTRTGPGKRPSGSKKPTRVEKGKRKGKLRTAAGSLR